MSEQVQLKENDARVLDQTLRTIYAHVASLNELDPDGAVRLMGENDATISMSEDGYRLTLKAGERPLRLEIDDQVTLTFNNAISVDCTSKGVVFDGLPQSLEAVGDDYLLPYFLRYARGELAAQIPQELNTNVEDGHISLAEIAVDVATAAEIGFNSNYIYAVSALRNLQPGSKEVTIDEQAIWNEVSTILDSPDIEGDRGYAEDGDYVETIFLESAWKEGNTENGVVGVVTRETAGENSVIVSVAIHNQNGFLILLEDGREELLATLEINISKDELRVLTQSGFEMLPEELYEPVYEFLRRSEEADI